MSKGTIQDEALRLSREHRDRLTSMGHDAALRAAIAIGIRYGRKHPEGEGAPVRITRMELGAVVGEQ